MTYSDERLEAYPTLFQLVAKCARSRRDLVSKLRGPMQNTARRLIAQGFVVPPPEVLDTLADALTAVSAEPVDDPTSSVPARIRLDAVLAFTLTFVKLNEQIDLSAFPEFAEWRQSSHDLVDSALAMSRRITLEGRSAAEAEIQDATLTANALWGSMFR